MKLASIAAAIILLATGACSAPPQSSAPAERGDAVGSTPTSTPAPSSPGTVSHGDASTNLETTPLSAADYAMYVAIMGGASAMLANLTSTDREALELEKKVEAGTATATPGTNGLLAQARSLRQKDIELARLQGVETRYLAVKAKVEAVIGPGAKPPAADDAVARENRRYLEAHRASIERLQKILRDPQSRQPQPVLPE
jgi:hypothetical protein